MERIHVRGDYMTLGQFLKEIVEIGSGGEAKWYLADYPVFVDGEEENRRGRKLYPGMIVTLADGRRYQMDSETCD